MEETTFLIIGGGIAGVSCAEGLAYLCPEERILLLTASSYVKMVTNVVPLTKMLARFDVVEASPAALSSIQQDSMKIVEDPVVSINSSEHIVITKSGKIIKYKKMCICTGGIPRLISSANDFVIGIRDTESVKSFQEKIKNSRRIMVVGNGGIATEIVYELSGVEIIWAIKDNHISAPFIDPGAAEFFQNKLTEGKQDTPDNKAVKRKVYTVTGGICKEGGAALGPDWHTNYDLHGNLSSKSKVTVEYKCEVSNILTGDEIETTCETDIKWPVYVKLSNGKEYGCDLIVSATGVEPNSRIPCTDNKQLDLAEDGGIKVNDKMETNLIDIFAAGDVCTPTWVLAPHWFQMRLWTQAHQMGSYAAKTMHASLTSEPVLQDFCFELFTHVTRFFGFSVVLLGLFNAQKLDSNYSCLLRVTPGLEYIKLVMKDGRMQGAVIIGDTDLEEMCENLILNQLDLKDLENDLLNPDIDIDDYFD